MSGRLREGAYVAKNDILYAVVSVGGQQYKVSTGDVIVVDRVAAEEGKSMALRPIAVRTQSGEFDANALEHTKVKATVAEHVLGKKIRVFTYKPKSTFRKTRGHRSRLSKLAIESITVKEQKETKDGA